MVFSPEQPKSPELKKNGIEKSAIEKGMAGALERVKKHADGESGNRRLEYHTEQHTLSVIARYKKILAFIRAAGVFVDERDEQIGELAAAFHDTILIQEEEDVIDQSEEFKGKKKRVYAPMNGTNESAGGELAKLYMQKVNEERPGVFMEADIEKIKGQILATKAFYDKDTHTFIQPNLTPESSLTERALALADLGACGMAGPEEFLSEGDALFREENLDIMDEINLFRSGADIEEEQQEYFRSRMRQWSEEQIAIAEGRKAMFDHDLSGLDPKAQHILKTKVFTKFDATIYAAKQRSEKRQRMSFMEVAQDMGYPIAA